MEAILVAVLGLLVGGAATHTHPRVNPGWPLGALAGLLGGMLGHAWWGGSLTSVLLDQPLAGAVASGALGGVVFAPLIGFVINILKAVWAQRRAHTTAQQHTADD